jgi:hypothetical protein
MFHTFGDSHCREGWNKIFINGQQLSRIHWIGPLLCYSFGKDKLLRINIADTKYNVKENDYVCFSVGEIDCRCHIHKHINNNSYQDIIDKIVENYSIAIEENIKQFTLLNVCIFSITPTKKMNGIIDNSEYGYKGSDIERRNYTEYFNKCLKNMCNKYNYIFIDVYDKYQLDGYLNSEFSDKDNIHINNPIHIINELKLKVLI